MKSDINECLQDAMSCLRASILEALDVYEERVQNQVVRGLPALTARPTACKVCGQHVDEARMQLEVVENDVSCIGGEVLCRLCGHQCQVKDVANSDVMDERSMLGRCSSTKVVDSGPVLSLPTDAAKSTSQGGAAVLLAPTLLGSSGHGQACYADAVSNKTPQVDGFSSQTKELSLTGKSNSGGSRMLSFVKRVTNRFAEPRSLRSTTGAINSLRIQEEEISKGRIYQIVKSENFEYAFGFVIFLNGVFLGVQANHRASHMGEEVVQTWWREVDLVFLAIFCCELVLRLVGQRSDFFLKPQWRMWNIFDMLVVLLPIVEEVIKHTNQGQGQGKDQSSNTPSLLRIVRVLRNVRIIRMVRIMRTFQELRLMLSSILCTMKSLCWACLLLVVIIWVFAIFFIEGACDHLQDNPEHIQEINVWYGSLWMTLVTLFMSICGGVNWGEPAFALKHAGTHFLILFVAFIAFTQFAVLNIVTGIFLQNANSTAARDLDYLILEDVSQKDRLRADIIQLFRECGPDESGGLTVDEFEEYLKDSRVRTFFAMLNLDIAEARDFFRALDEDSSGIVDMNEFVDGCMRLRGSPKSVDLVNTLRLTKQLMDKMNGLLEAQTTGSTSVSLSKNNESIQRKIA